METVPETPKEEIPETVPETPKEEIPETVPETPKEETPKSVELKPFKRKQIEILLNGLEGTIFKIDDAYFKVCYCNVGRARFTAELVNDKEW